MRAQRWKLVLLASVPVILAVIFVGLRRRCLDEVRVDVGYFSTINAGDRAAIQRLASELKRCPHANIFRIQWIVEKHEQVDIWAMVYNRDMKMLGFEPEPGSTLYSDRYRVNDADIYAVAKSNGRTQDLFKYSTKPNPW